MTRHVTLGSLVAVALTTVALVPGSAQEERAVTIQSMDVRDNLYVIAGGGGHTAALVTQEHGVVIVDTKLAGFGQSIIDTMQLISEQPITTIINTHTHGDHVGGNADFPASVEIIAHANTASRMQQTEAIAGQASAMPDRTYADRMTLFEGRDRIVLYHFGAGHTDGDTVVVFPALGTIHMGDLFAFRGPPYVDLANNDRGDLIIARLTPDGYEEIDRTPLIAPTSRPGNRRELTHVNWSHPAYANRHIIARNDEEIISASLAAP